MSPSTSQSGWTQRAPTRAMAGTLNVNFTGWESAAGGAPGVWSSSVPLQRIVAPGRNDAPTWRLSVAIHFTPTIALGVNVDWTSRVSDSSWLGASEGLAVWLAVATKSCFTWWSI